MVWKATVVFIASGLTGSGIVAFTRSADEPELKAEVAAPSGATTASPDLSNEEVQRRTLQAKFAVQHPFASLYPADR